jgi:hypothetical protein
MVENGKGMRDSGKTIGMGLGGRGERVGPYGRQASNRLAGRLNADCGNPGALMNPIDE